MLPTARTASASWNTHGVIIEVVSLDEAPALANALAAEHVELAVEDPEPLFRAIRHAGSIFLGRHTSEAIGDYIAGPNHVLPTGRRARFASGLSVLDFMKRTSFIQLDEPALRAIGDAAIALAEAEGLQAHARSVAVRLGQ
jgi:histidinol dehydrogenase